MKYISDRRAKTLLTRLEIIQGRVLSVKDRMKSCQARYGTTGIVTSDSAVVNQALLMWQRAHNLLTTYLETGDPNETMEETIEKLISRLERRHFNLKRDPEELVKWHKLSTEDASGPANQQ